MAHPCVFKFQELGWRRLALAFPIDFPGDAAGLGPHLRTTGLSYRELKIRVTEWIPKDLGMAHLQHKLRPLKTSWEEGQISLLVSLSPLLSPPHLPHPMEINCGEGGVN